MSFFAPGTHILKLPAWDSLPYDRVSPNPEICATRMNTLARLVGQAPPKAPSVLLTTVNATLQRLPPRSSIEGAVFQAGLGAVIEIEGLLQFLVRNGYSRTGTVMEPGEFATRGGIVDIFPAGVETPVRLDFFGDTLESVRLFDPLTQITIGEGKTVDLVPVSEVQLTEETTARFRQGYRDLFGAVTDDDPLYAAIREGSRHAGMEHWLPLFHDGLETLFDYVDEGVITLDHQSVVVRDERLEQIEDYYEARVEAQKNPYDGAPQYKPVPTETMFLDAKTWDSGLTGRPGGMFTPFAAPESAQTIEFAGRQGRNFAAERAQADINVFDAVRDHVAAQRNADRRVVFAAFSRGSAERMALLLDDHGIDDVRQVDHWPAVMALPAGVPAMVVLGFEQGVETADLAIISEQDVLGDRLARRRRGKRAEDFITEQSQLADGDLVVHVEHGIGRYVGLQTIEVGGAPHDCLEIHYDGNAKLFLPAVNIELLSRYGSEDAGVNLDRLGGAAWQARKAKLKQHIRDMADQLIKVAAERVLRSAPTIEKPDGLYEEFCARFPYDETEDQMGAIEDIFNDLQKGTPMDRLVCGDVGFGKTEVALRGAFAAVMTGGQVAIVAPTTLLRRQHFQTFKERFAGLPVKVRQLSRLVGTAEAAATREGLTDGQIDIVIGTHALLGKKIAFRNLTLLVIDEEQHFGVAHKERLKQLRSDVHVLTLTATPIPRTLQMAFSGVKELSLIATPPVDRLAVRTFVMPFDPVVTREALLREHHRGGQSFYVCPRILDLPDVERFLTERVPEVKFATAHGRMAPRQLEDVMSAFYDGAYDVLLSTTIIESGLDIPTANTLIVHRADRFGLSQLYQLRGRIGRSKIRAYAYFTLPPKRLPTEAADKRLKVLQSLDTLGAGFSLASHDLDLRGAGNLLGEEQSGHIREVGFELYNQMLEEALATARSGAAGGLNTGEQDWSPQINLGTAVMIPDHYVADLSVRLGLYRRLAHLQDEGEIDAFAAELIDRFGALPEEVENLLAIIGIKRLCRAANVAKIDAGPGGASVVFRNDTFANPAGLVEFINDNKGSAKLRPDHKLVFQRQWDEAERRLKGVDYLVRHLAKLAQSTSAVS
ncbi:MAG: transcription-repair coupling factor [Rhodospirillaceae bacterium]|nr:transcription-repair coupling factor [Rhodospirillaceae bacterium]